MYLDSKASTNKRSPFLPGSSDRQSTTTQKGLLQMKIVTAFLTVAITLATVQSTIATTTPQQPETPQQPPHRGTNR
ncbi:hypothetical protein [Nostoc cycadae]|uniref:hypothetical protein n=1 Tax=Nostoc cycadae TaxID=246795 RepID=UPI0011AF1D54|nr:hypothetical protein [Nostoc cycadae]